MLTHWRLAFMKDIFWKLNFILVQINGKNYWKFILKKWMCCLQNWFHKVDCTGSLRSWFIDLWNSTLVNFLRQVRDYGSYGDDHGCDGDDHVWQVVQQASAEDRLDFEDPVRFVLRTWPWPDQAEGLPQVPILMLMLM